MYEQSLCKSLNIKEWKFFELQITQTRHPLSILPKKNLLKFKTPKNDQEIHEMCTKNKVHIFNVWIINMQSLNIKEWNLFEIQITHTLHNVSTPKVLYKK